MIDDFDAVLPPANEDEEEERPRSQPAREPDDGGEWRSEFRSYLDDPA